MPIISLKLVSTFATTKPMEVMLTIQPGSVWLCAPIDLMAISLPDIASGTAQQVGMVTLELIYVS